MPATAAGPYPIRHVDDGDTIQVTINQATVTVRLIGIDTPETVKPNTPVQCYGPEASARTKQLLTGHTVWLETDPSQDQVDKYGRTLAYVWLDQTTMVDEVLVRDGYAHEYTYNTAYRYQSRFLTAQADARAAHRGLWSPTTCNGITQ